MERLINRKSNRLWNYDYSSPGAYFVTICVHDNFKRKDIFGNVEKNNMILNELGIIINKFWGEISEHYAGVKLDKYVIMPDHIYGIIWLNDDTVGKMPVNTGTNTMGTNAVGTDPVIVGTEQCSVPTTTISTIPLSIISNNKYGKLSKIIKSFKNAVTTHIKNSKYVFAWQRSYHDRIIRNDEELNRIREYIIENPSNWKVDVNDYLVKNIK